MSHLCKVKMKWRDLGCVKAAAEVLGFQWVKGGRVRYYSGNGPECEYTIEFNGKRGIPQKYNAGLKKEGTSYELLIDNSIQGRVVHEAGVLAGKTDTLVKDFRMEYGKQLLKKKAQENNWQYQFMGVNAKGRAKVRLTV